MSPVFTKKILLAVSTNFTSFLPLDYKFGLIFTLLHICFALVLDVSKFHLEVETLKQIFLKNGYSERLIDTCVSKFLNNLFVEKPIVLNVPKKELNTILPFLGSNSDLVRNRLFKTLHRRISFCKTKVILKIKNRFKNLFSFKDKLLETLKSCKIYKFTLINLIP